jgi:O-6-methylguanine DNA methyltransferase
MILNRACFSTEIGILYYLWLDEGQGPAVAALTASSEWLDDHISSLKQEYPGLSVRQKKYPRLEEVVTGYLDRGLELKGVKPVFLAGTIFQKRVWKEAAGVPYGCTCSYGDLAAMSGRPGAGRAAGNAMGKNPVMLIVPCHRIIKGDGSPGGFGSGPELKKKLLALEGTKF